MDFYQIFSFGILLMLAIRNGATEISSLLPSRSKYNRIENALDNSYFSFSNAGTNYRLPNTIEPISYDIELTPFLETNFTFQGTVEIRVKSIIDINEIVLHAGRLQIISHEIRTKDGPVEKSERNHVPQTERLIISLHKTIVKNEEFTIKIQFNGTLSDDMKGFYRSSYKDYQGKLR